MTDKRSAMTFRPIHNFLGKGGGRWMPIELAIAVA